MASGCHDSGIAGSHSAVFFFDFFVTFLNILTGVSVSNFLSTIRRRSSVSRRKQPAENKQYDDDSFGLIRLTKCLQNYLILKSDSEEFQTPGAINLL